MTITLTALVGAGLCIVAFGIGWFANNLYHKWMVS